MKRVLVNFPPTYLDHVKATANDMGLSLPELIRIGVSHWTVCEDGEESVRRKIAERVLDTNSDSETIRWCDEHDSPTPSEGSVWCYLMGDKGFLSPTEITCRITDRLLL